MVSKARLSSFFKGISKHFNCNIEGYPEGLELIDRHLFTDLLALCSFEVPYGEPEPSAVEKILLFVEKIAQSDGPRILLERTGKTRLPHGYTLDILSFFRNEYKNYFESEEFKKPTFYDVMRL